MPSRPADRRVFGPGPFLLGLRWRGGPTAGDGFPLGIPAVPERSLHAALGDGP